MTPREHRVLMHKMHEILTEVGSYQPVRDALEGAAHFIKVKLPLPDFDDDDSEHQD